MDSRLVFLRPLGLRLFILKHREKLKAEIKARQAIVQKSLGMNIEGLICSYLLKEDSNALSVQQHLIDEGFLVGAIRPPTVPKPILRLIPRLGESTEALETLCHLIQKENF